MLVWQTPRDANLSSVAHTLETRVRTLRRHLVAEGKSYNDTLNEALGTIAKTCRRDARRTVMDTAHALGFSDNTGFRRAFERWTGLTPHEYRRQSASLTDTSSCGGHKMAPVAR